MPPGPDNQEVRDQPTRPVDTSTFQPVVTNNQLAMLTQDLLRRDRTSFSDLLNRNNDRTMDGLGLRDFGIRTHAVTEGSQNPVQGRDDKGRPNKLDWNGTPLEVKRDSEGKVTKIVYADNPSKTFLDAQSVKNGEVKVDDKTGNISFQGPSGQKIEYNLKDGTKSSTSADGKERTVTDAHNNKTIQEGDGRGNFTTTGYQAKDGTKYKLEMDPFNDKNISSVTKPGENGQPDKKVEGGDLSFDKNGRLNQQIGDRTYVYDKDLNLVEARGKDGKTLDKVGENGVKSLKLNNDGTLVADLGDNKFRSTSPDGSRAQYTDTPVTPNDPNSNVKRELQQLDSSGRPSGPKYSMTVDKAGKIQGNEVTKTVDGKEAKLKVENGKIVDKQGNRTVTRDAHLNATEVAGENGAKIAKVGERGVQSIKVDDKGNVVANLGDGKYRATAADGTVSEYREKPVPGKPGQFERTYHSPPGLSTIVSRGDNGEEKILEAKRNGETVAKVGQDKVQSIRLDNTNNVVAETTDGKTRVTTPEGKKLKYQDKPVAGQPGQFERTYSSPPGYTATVTKGADGKEQITEIKKGDVVLAKAGENGIKSIESIDGEGKITAKLNDDKTFKVIGADGKEAARYTERTEGGKTIRSFNPPAGVEVTMENGQPREVKYDTKDRKETWTIGDDGTATRTGGTGDLNKLEKASIDPATGQVKGEAALKDKNNQPEKVQVALNPDGSRTETRTAKDKAGTSYEYTTTRGKNGYPISVQHPIMTDGKVVPNSQQTTRYDYERDGSGNVVTRNGQPQVKRIDFQTLAPDGTEKNLAMTRQADGKWGLSESVYNALTHRTEERPIMKNGQPVAWNANPRVEADGTLKLRDVNGSFSTIRASGEVSQRPIEDFRNGPQTEAEKEAAKKRSEIVQVGTQADGKKTWGQGVPTVDTQWGFGNFGVDKGSFGPQTFMGDQGYSFSISQQVGKDEQNNDVIQRRETVFNTEKGVQIYYRDAEGNMKSIHNVTSMVSERQADGSYKITYNVQGQNPGDSNAPQPVTVQTTRDGRYVDGDGMPVGGRLDPPAQPRRQSRASSTSDNPQTNVTNLEQQIRNIDTSTPQGKQQADQLAQQLIQQQTRVEDQRIAEAAQQNNRLAELEAERRRADLDFQARSQREREQLLARIKSGESINRPEPTVRVRPETPVTPVQPARPRPALPVLPDDPSILPFGPGCGPTG